MNPEIERLIKLTVATGEISDKKRTLIMNKAKSLGEDLDEVELVLNGELALLKNGNNPVRKEEQLNVKHQVDDTVNPLLVFRNYLNRYKFLKYALIFFLVNLLFFLLTIIAF